MARTIKGFHLGEVSLKSKMSKSLAEKSIRGISNLAQTDHSNHVRDKSVIFVEIQNVCVPICGNSLIL